MSDTNILTVYTITEGANEKTYWNKIGVAFVNKDGSLNVTLNAFPVNGKLHIREKNGETPE